ncbi:MAG: hypothetical protein CME57_07110 [Halieaceae bacterium]|nr:hypothetical protein [Halieaceae bacterium]
MTIRVGLFSRKLLIEDNEIVEPTRNSIASMALSLDQIAIKLRSSRGVLISPRYNEHLLKH